MEWTTEDALLPLQGQHAIPPLPLCARTSVGCKSTDLMRSDRAVSFFLISRRSGCVMDVWVMGMGGGGVGFPDDFLQPPSSSSHQLMRALLPTPGKDVPWFNVPTMLLLLLLLLLLRLAASSLPVSCGWVGSMSAHEESNSIHGVPATATQPPRPPSKAGQGKAPAATGGDPGGRQQYEQGKKAMEGWGGWRGGGVGVTTGRRRMAFFSFKLVMMGESSASL